MTTQSQSAMRSADTGPGDIATVADGINALYDSTLDVIVVRNALPRAPPPRVGSAAKVPQ